MNLFSYILGSAPTNFSLNIKKTKFSLFSPNRQITTNQSISLNNIRITQVGSTLCDKSIKFLGIYLDDNLSWKTHIQNLISKLSFILFTLNKIKNILPHSALKSLYFTLIHCNLIYGLIVWGNSSSVSKLFLIQKRAIRIINKKSYRAHTDHLFKSEQILKLQDLYKLHVLLFMFDYLHHKLPGSFINLFPYPIP